MTSLDALSIQQVAARAALTVSGVAELQPSLGQCLAGAAAWVRRGTGAPPAPAAGGVHAHHMPGRGGWTIEVRCVLHGDRRALDVARDVHDQVRTAITSHMAGHTPPEPVQIAVTVTRIAGLRAGDPSHLGHGGAATDGSTTSSCRQGARNFPSDRR